MSILGIFGNSQVQQTGNIAGSVNMGPVKKTEQETRFPSDSVNLSGASGLDVSVEGNIANMGVNGGVTSVDGVGTVNDVKTLQQIEKPVEEAPVQSSYSADYVPGESARLIHTKSTEENLRKLAISNNLSENVLLVGPTGAGKTAIVKYLAHLTQSGLRRINLSDMTDVTEIIGGYKPNAQGRPEWQDGIVVEAMRKGQWLLLDEVNLADPAVLERLNSLLDDDRCLVLPEKNNERVESHPDFRVFATMNPASYAGRKKLSKAMMNRFRQVWMDGLEPAEMAEILQKKTDLPKETIIRMAMFHQQIADLAEHRQVGKKSGPYPFTLRDMQKVLKRYNHFHAKHPEMDPMKIIWRESLHVYQDRFIEDKDKQVVEDFLKTNYGEKARVEPVEPQIVEGRDKVTIGDMDLKVNPSGGQFVPSAKSKLVSIKSTNMLLERMAKCVEFDEPVLLVGPTAAGKTAKVKYLANLTNNDLRRYNLSMQTDTTDFIGGYKPTGVPGEYKWSDGILVDAMKKGQWVVLDEINLAEPSILERINSLLDGDRSLVLTEKGNERVEAHPNFRVFATMNPPTSEYGGRNELSPAMRNRFSELWDPGVTEKDELKTLMGVFMSKVPGGDELGAKMVDFQNELSDAVNDKRIAEKQRGDFVYTIRNLKSWADFIKVFQNNEEDGKVWGPEKAFVEGAIHIYGSEMADKNDRKAIEEMADKYVKA